MCGSSSRLGWFQASMGKHGSGGGGWEWGAISPISRRMLWLWKGGFLGKVEAEMVWNVKKTTVNVWAERVRLLAVAFKERTRPWRRAPERSLHGGRRGKLGYKCIKCRPQSQLLLSLNLFLPRLLPRVIALRQISVCDSCLFLSKMRSLLLSIFTPPEKWEATSLKAYHTSEMGYGPHIIQH